MDDGKRWFSIPEAAQALGMSKQTLWRRVRSGVLKLPTLEGRIVVPASRLELLRLTPAIAARRYRRAVASGGADDRAQ